MTDRGAAGGGAVVWITGLPGAGKSTLAAHVADRVRRAALPCAVLDGDEVRAALGRPAGAGAAERDSFYESLGRLAALLARQGLAVIVPATANRAAHRERARALAPRWIEVHVATPAAECERRDPRGLWAAARAGAAEGVPGVDAPYEPPAAPHVVASGGEDGAAADRILALVAEGTEAAPGRSPAGRDSESHPFVPSPDTSARVHDRAMAIVCGTDLSDRSRPALAAAAAIARRTGQPLRVVHVVAGAELIDAPARERLVAAATERLGREVVATVGALDAGVRANVLVGHAVRDLLAFARSEQASMVVVSSQGHAGSPLYRVGGTSERIALESPLPVVVVRSAAPFEAWARGERPLRVLVGVDFTASSLSAVQWVKALRRAGPCEVVVGHVYDAVDALRRYGKGGAHSLVDADPDVERLLERDVAAIAGDLADHGTAIRVHLALGRLADHVVELAEAERADVIVVGTHHRRGPARLWSVSTGVLHLGRVSVATVPTQPGTSLAPEGIPAVRRVLVATDLSPASYWATSFAYALVGREGGDVHLLHVVRPPGKEEEEPPDLAGRLRALVPTIAEREGITTHVEIARGSVVREICSAAERLGVDVVCLASHGESGIKTVLGSVVSGVLRESTKPVLVLHPPPA